MSLSKCLINKYIVVVEGMLTLPTQDRKDALLKALLSPMYLLVCGRIKNILSEVA